MKRVSRSEAMHRQIARHIANEIAAGVLPDGARLPSTRELAQEWGVSPYTISQAMDLLTQDGLVVSKPRAGRVVKATHPERLRERQQTTSPQVLLVGGYAGSGKTELGRCLARETGWPMLDKDTLTRPVVEAALEILGQSPHDRESDTYLKRVRPREYESLIAALTENIECGNSAIVTAPFIREFADTGWLNRVHALCRDKSAVLTVVWVYCDPETMHTYLRRRGAARDAAKLADWPGYLASIDVNFRPAVPHRLIDNSLSSEPLQDQARKLLRDVQEGGRQ